MSVNRADVVMIDWLFSDRTGSKIRPAVVVQADFLNGLIDDTVLIAVTGASRGASSTEVLIDPTVETNSGLLYPSVASCNNFLTTEQALIRRTIGHLTNAAMQQIEVCLKRALHLQ